MTDEIIKEIKQLKEDKNAIILAHNYQPKEIQEVADFIGDSLELCLKASEIDDSDIIVFCGVNFMAETAAIICPDKKVLLPDNRANCQMADMVSLEELKQAKEENPDCEVVLYVNSRAPSRWPCRADSARRGGAGLRRAHDGEGGGLLPCRARGARAHGGPRGVHGGCLRRRALSAQHGQRDGHTGKAAALLRGLGPAGGGGRGAVLG